MSNGQWLQRGQFLMQVGVSALVLVVAVVIVLSGSYDESYNKWAFGIIGVVVGYWLR